MLQSAGIVPANTERGAPWATWTRARTKQTTRSLQSGSPPARGVDIDGDGQTDAVEVATLAAVDIDGDGIPDAVAMRTTTAVDVDSDGTPDAVVVVDAIGADVDGDGEISEDEVAVTGAVFVEDDDGEG